MSNLFDYLAWRGDLPLDSTPLCPVDTLLLSMLPYIRLESLVPAAEEVRLADALEGYAARTENANAEHLPLVRTLAASARFGPLRVTEATKELDPVQGVQFAAITVLLPKQELFVAFEGTDDTLIGWEEDLRMSYECPVPAQSRAVSYLCRVAARYPQHRILVGGHSKGGNLAMYAAVHCGPEYRRRIRDVYNHDGPGFCEGTLTTPAYLELRDRIHTYLPASSIVAVLLEHDNNYKIVQSTQVGLLQHDPYSWQILGNDFVYTDKRTAFGIETEAIVDRFASELSPARKKQFVQALFTVLEATGQDTLSGIMGKKGRSLRRALHAFTELDHETRTLLQDSLISLGRSVKELKK